MSATRNCCSVTGRRGYFAVISLAVLVCALTACQGGQSGAVTATHTTGSSTPSITATAMTSAPPCVASQLRMTATPDGAASGHIATLYQFINISSATCSLQGFPGARMLDEAGLPLAITVEQVTNAYTWKRTPLNMIEIPPGSSAYFRMQTQNAPLASGQSCVTAASTIIYPPQIASGFSSPVKTTMCNGVVYLSPVVANVNDL